MVKVKEVVEKNGIAVRISFVANETVGTVLAAGNDGKPVELPHSRFREDDRMVRSSDDLFFPPADYRQMFKVAGAILGKSRKKKAQG